MARSRKEESNALVAARLADALSLVRGLPFSGLPSGMYGWADRSDFGSQSTVLAKDILDAATCLAQLAIDATDAALASYAVFQGQLVWLLDVELAKLELSAAALVSRGAVLARAGEVVNLRYKKERQELPEEVAEHYRRLRRGEDQMTDT